MKRGKKEDTHGTIFTSSAPNLSSVAEFSIQYSVIKIVLEYISRNTAHVMCRQIVSNQIPNK